MVSQELKFGNDKYTLGKAQGETLEAKQLEHLGGDGVPECQDQDLKTRISSTYTNRIEGHKGFDPSSSGRCSQYS